MERKKKAAPVITPAELPKPAPIFTVYAIRCDRNGKLFIGKSVNVEERIKSCMADLRRISKYPKKNWRSISVNMINDFREFGECAFSFWALESGSESEAREKTKYWIEYYDTTNEAHGYNSHPGGITKKPSKIIITHGLPPMPAGQAAKEPQKFYLKGGRQDERNNYQS